VDNNLERGFVEHENTESAIKNGQSSKTGNIGYTRRRKTKQKHNTICVGHHYTQTKTNYVNKIRQNNGREYGYDRNMEFNITEAATKSYEQILSVQKEFLVKKTQYVLDTTIHKQKQIT
jgi:hypothetical protein